MDAVYNKIFVFDEWKNLHWTFYVFITSNFFFTCGSTYKGKTLYLQVLITKEQNDEIYLIQL